MPCNFKEDHSPPEIPEKSLAEGEVLARSEIRGDVDPTSIDFHDVIAVEVIEAEEVGVMGAIGGDQGHELGGLIEAPEEESCSEGHCEGRRQDQELEVFFESRAHGT